MMFSWRRLSAGARVVVLVGTAAAVEAIAILLQLKLPLIPDTSLFHTAIAVYLAAIALDEIDFRDLLAPRAAFSALRCRWATAWYAPTRTT